MGRKAIDETGIKYGNLTAIKREGTDTHKHSLWLCQCDCGNFLTVQVANLRNGHTASCGCKRQPNEIGNKYNKLTIIRKIEHSSESNNKSYYECQCECGNLTVVRIDRLRNGETQSCGCLKSVGESQISKLLLLNNIDFIKEYSFNDLLSEKGFKLRFDFGVLHPNKTLNYLIEYDGAQHFIESSLFDRSLSLQERQQRDKIKEEYCIKNNIRLIRVSYKDEITLDKLL